MPAGMLAAAQAFGPGSLHAIAQKPLEVAPDVWDPTGTFVGHLATCEVWETATGLYRGALPPTVCAGWKSQEAQADGGRWSLRAEKTQLWLLDDHRGLLDDGCRVGCAPWIASSLRHDGRRAAGVRRGSDQLVVWDTDEPRVVNRWQLERPVTEDARLAWNGDQLVVIGQTREDAWVYDSGYGAPGVALRQGSDPVAGPLVDAIVLAAVLGRRDVLADFVAGREIPVPGVLARDP